MSSVQHAAVIAGVEYLKIWGEEKEKLGIEFGRHEVDV